MEFELLVDTVCDANIDWENPFDRVHPCFAYLTSRPVPWIIGGGYWTADIWKIV